MAAIIQPRPHTSVPQRPALRLVTAHGGRTVEAPIDLGLTPAHIVAAVVGIVLVVLLSIAIGSGALAGLAPAPSAGAPSAGASAGTSAAAGVAAGTTAQLEVHSGDTFWSIARRLQPTGDVRPLVDRLIELNGTTILQPGEQIVVPA
ncbi:LysM peptidoglycan-binding domain-containing protein [Aquihabitans sp. McL0605]|uniref:LysM peptidoglycan-binding domain-containing protein n=1 Tax=Aquihabitans sp. McL0605 TaxID=3415671 RepID=UPI003CF7EB08